MVAIALLIYRSARCASGIRSAPLLDMADERVTCTPGLARSAKWRFLWTSRGGCWWWRTILGWRRGRVLGQPATPYDQLRDFENPANWSLRNFLGVSHG